MKIRTILFAVGLVLAILIATSCSASKYCPAYGKTTTEQNDNVAG